MEVENVHDTPPRAREDLQEKAKGLASYVLSWLKPLKKATQGGHFETWNIGILGPVALLGLDQGK